MAEMRACSYVNMSDEFTIRVRMSLDPDDNGFVIPPGGNMQSHQASTLYLYVDIVQQLKEPLKEPDAWEPEPVEPKQAAE